MAETDNNPQGGVNDTLKMRNTETAVLKRIPVSPNAASASSAARKTIKLKPLVPSSPAAGSADSPSPSPAPKPSTVAPPSILMNRKPAAPKTEEPPKFMSTNTAPIGKMSKPSPEKPIDAASLNDAPTKTVSIPRLQAKMASKPAPAPAAPAETTATVTVPKAGKPAAPAPAEPVENTATVGVPKISRPVTPAPGTTATVGVPKVSTATVGVPKISRPITSAPGTTATVGVPKVSTATVGVPKISRPVTPAPGTTATVGVPKVGNPAAPVSPNAQTVVLPNGTSTTTQGIQKQAIDQAKMQSGLQGAKPAIKLRPSASPAQSQENLNPTSPTIKLSPKTESTVSPMPSPSTDQSADDGGVTVTTKIPRKTLQLKPKMPSTDTAKLKEQGDISNRNIKTGLVEEGEQTIKQSAEALEAGKKKSAKENDKASAEPNIIFSICAILAFLVIGYTVFALTAQFLNTWQGTQIPVPGFPQVYDGSRK